MPDGFTLRGQVGEYVSNLVPIINSKYELLVINPSDTLFADAEIVFLLEDILANEKDVLFVLGIPVLKLGFDLTFPNLPGVTPTPVPSASITALIGLGVALLLL
ncbi:MAG: hypothetical protein COB86_07265, partial [Dehalococcoidia bacterium]